MSTVKRNNAARTLLARLLEHALVTRGSLAITLGVGVDKIARYERGEEQMPLEIRARLAEAAVAVTKTDPEMHHRALAFRNQIVATRAYESGATTRMSGPPRLPWWTPR